MNINIMKLIHITLLIISSLTINAQSILSDFEKVMNEYNEAFTSTDDIKEQEAINQKYESLISKAEKQMEVDLEAQFQKEQQALFDEEAAFNKQLLEDDQFDNDVEDENEVEFTEHQSTFIAMYNEGVPIQNIAAAFKESELIEIGELYGFKWTTQGSKIQKVQAIIGKMKEVKHL